MVAIGAATFLGSLSGPTITAHYLDLAERGGRRGRSLSASTVHLLHRVLHKALADAVEADLIATNPVTKAKPLRHRRPQTEVWTAEQATQFLTARAKAQDRLAWAPADERICLSSGCSDRGCAG